MSEFLLWFWLAVRLRFIDQKNKQKTPLLSSSYSLSRLELSCSACQNRGVFCCVDISVRHKFIFILFCSKAVLMSVLFRCPGCKQKLKIADRKIGHAIRCPACGHEAVVPPPETDDSPVETPPFQEETIQEETVEPSAKTEQEEAGFVEPPPQVEPPEPPSPTYWEEEGEDDDDEDAGFVVSRRAADDEEMDLTPMVDVTFLLLIFFMITASFSIQKTIQIPPPDKDEKGVTQSVEDPEEILEASIQVDITAENIIIVEGEELSDPDDLEDRLRELQSGSEGKNELVLSADDLSFHEMTVRVFDIANKVKMQKISMKTYTGSGE